MKQLRGLDAGFLHLENATTVGHVNGLGIYDRPSPDFDPYARTRERFGAMVGRVEPMRRRLVEVPLGLDHPYWIDDPHFDLDYHVRRIALPTPGNEELLTDQVARIIARRMDRTRPLWEVYVIEGLADGRWAMLTKTHHATIDGAAGVLLLAMLTDADPGAACPEPVAWSGEQIPTDGELLRRTARHLAVNPVKAARLQLRLVKNLAEAAGMVGVGALASRARDLLKSAVQRDLGPGDPGAHERRITLPVTPAPETPWNHTISPHRRFAMRSTSLADVKTIKLAAGATVNDVVMAICAGALRAYLVHHGALPDRPLRAMVPVSIRTGDEADPWTNRVSAIVAELPTDCESPLDRLDGCHRAMASAKHQFDLVPADVLGDVVEFASPLVATAAMGLATRFQLADHVHLPANVTISNVPGPRETRYFAGARLERYIPVSIVADGMGLNTTVHSYGDRLDFGLVSDRLLVPDLEFLADLHVAEIEVLLEATGLRPRRSGNQTGPADV